MVSELSRLGMPPQFLHPAQPGSEPGLGFFSRSSCSAFSSIMMAKLTSPRIGSLYRGSPGYTPDASGELPLYVSKGLKLSPVRGLVGTRAFSWGAKAEAEAARARAMVTFIMVAKSCE